MFKEDAIIYAAGLSAQKQAIDMMAYSSSEWPKPLVSGLEGISERLHDIGIAFAIYVRRFLELTGERPIIRQLGLSFDTDQSDLETRLYEATNALIHAHNFQISWHPNVNTRFDEEEAFQAIFFVCKTDRYPSKHIPILGAAWTFLTCKKNNHLKIERD